jgi:predicted ATPase
MAGAYQTAREYATIGLDLLGNEAWQRQYEMTLAFHKLAAEIASLCGEFDLMDRWINATVDRARTPLDLVDVHIVKIQAFTSKDPRKNNLDIEEPELEWV